MRSVTVTLVDDLDAAKPADETVSFGLDGREYEIDLSKAHAGELRKMANRYITAARRPKTAVRQRPARRTQADRERAREIRAWAVQKGLMTTERGRIPEHVTREYEASKRAESSRLPVKLCGIIRPSGRGSRYAPIGVSTNTGIVRLVFF